jgi:hypothetical protein
VCLESLCPGLSFAFSLVRLKRGFAAEQAFLEITGLRPSKRRICRVSRYVSIYSGHVKHLQHDIASPHLRHLHHRCPRSKYTVTLVQLPVYPRSITIALPRPCSAVAAAHPHSCIDLGPDCYALMVPTVSWKRGSPPLISSRYVCHGFLASEQ